MMAPGRDDPPSWDALVKVPANVDQEDRLLLGLTARQLAQLAAVLAALWTAWRATRRLVPAPVFAGGALLVLATAIAVVLTRRDGLTLDRWLAAAWRHARAPHRLIPAPGEHLPPGLAPLPLPVSGIGDDGTLDLGTDGRVVLARAGTVNFTLRTGGEQQALVAAFGRWLNALAGPVQILVRTRRLDLDPLVAGLRAAGPGLPHRLLEEAALEHADFLSGLGAERDLLTRQVLLAHRENATDSAAGQRARRRAEEAACLLAAAEVGAELLPAPAAFAALAAAVDPGTPPHPAPALPDQIITAAPMGADA
jgi:hypothetical protein